MVQNIPPINPSTVFLGDNDERGVLPNILPKIYALISLHITKLAGRINLQNINLLLKFFMYIYQTNPLKIFAVIRLELIPKMNKII
jgi:hypothetical protein